MPRQGRLDAGALRGRMQDVPYGDRAREPAVRRAHCREQVARGAMYRTTAPQITQERSGDRWQQGKQELHAGLWASDAHGGLAPADVVEHQADYFTGTEPIDAHHQQNRIVAPRDRAAAVDGAQDPLHIAPWQGTMRPLGYAYARRHDGARQVMRYATRRFQKPKIGA